MWYAIHGYEIQAMPTSRGMFGHGRVLPPNWRAREHCRACSGLLLTKAARRMRRDGFCANRLWLWLDIRDDSWFGQHELRCVQDDHACVARLAALWEKARAEIPVKVKIIRVDVALFDLSPAGMRQLDPFADDDRERQTCEVVTNTMDSLNRKFEKRVVTLGAWTPPPGGYAGGKIAYNRIPSAEDVDNFAIYDPLRPYVVREDDVYFPDPFRLPFAEVIRQVDKHERSMGFPSGKLRWEDLTPHQILLLPLHALNQQVKAPLGEREWSKLAWLFDRIAKQLGIDAKADRDRPRLGQIG